MATIPVVGNGPFEFTDANGKQVSIPLSALQFENGNLEVDPSTQFAKLPDLVAIVNPLLRYLSSQQLIVPAVAPSPKPAMVITAADPGSAGNNITIQIKVTPDASLDPTKANFNVTVTETDTYKGVSAANIEATLGSSKVAGTQPGLVRVNTVKDLTGIPAPADYPLTGGGPGTRAKVDVKDKTPAVILTLEAKKEGSEGARAIVTISNVDNGKKTFDVKVTWTNNVKGLTLGTIQNLAAFGYEISVSPPPSGVFSVPVDTGNAPIPLSGGADGASPSAASAIVFASQ